MGCSMLSWVPVLAQEQLQLSEQQCNAMRAAHAAVLAQLRELLEARQVLSTRMQVRDGNMQLSSLWAAHAPKGCPRHVISTGCLGLGQRPISPE